MAISVFDLFKIGVGPSSSHTVGPLQIEPRLMALRETQCLLLAGQYRVPFVWQRDMRLLDENLPYHPNAMTLSAFAEDHLLLCETYYSIGGGFVIDQQQAESGQLDKDLTELPYDFSNASLLGSGLEWGLITCQRGLGLQPVV